jgi:hypothetical protein
MCVHFCGEMYYCIAHVYIYLERSCFWSVWNIGVTNEHRNVPLVINTSRSFSHSWLFTGFVTRVTRRVSLVEQEMLTFPNHLISPRVLVGFVLLDLYFMCMFCKSLFVFLSFFFWPLCCLSFFDLRILITPFDIFKLFLRKIKAKRDYGLDIEIWICTDRFSFPIFRFWVYLKKVILERRRIH